MICSDRNLNLTLEMIRNSDDQRVALLTSEPASGTDKLVVVAPGYEHRIRHMAILSHVLTKRGIGTIRFDLTDHLGVSDGEIETLTMTSICQDVEAVLRHARARHPDHDLVLLAPSLSARAALRALAAVQDELCGAILLLPVMEVMDTIRRASGSDLLGQFRRGELDPNQKLFRVVEHDVAVGFGVDAFDEGWVGIEGTVRDLCAVRIPLLGIAAERDAWVDVEDVAQVFSQATNQQRVVLLQATSHDLAHNLPVMRQVMTLVLEEVERVMGLPAAGVAEFVDSLDIDEIVTVMRQERELASDDYAALAAAQVGE